MAHWSTQTHSVRERFGLGVVLVAMAYCSFFMAVFRAFQASWPAILYGLGLAFGVTLAQVLARRYEAPRAVSAFIGGAYAVAWTLAVQAANGYVGADRLVLGVIAVFGMIAGYVAGAVVASIFLVHDALHDTFRARREQREALREARGQGPPDSPFDEPLEESGP